MKYTLVNRVLFAQKKKKNGKLSTQYHKTVPIKKKSQDSIMQTKKKYMEITAQSKSERSVLYHLELIFDNSSRDGSYFLMVTNVP